jgi:hypothetical protein
MRFVPLVTLVLVWALALVTGQQLDPLERAHPAIQYSRPSNDPVASLLRSREAISRLRSDGPSGHLRSILDALDIPVSSHIYSPQFERLPAEAKAAVYSRLWAILSGKAAGAQYRQLSAVDRRAVIEILRDTKPDLPEYFRG